MENRKQISDWTRKNLHIQGFDSYTDEDLNELKYGIRFAYIGCGLIVAVGLLMQSPQILGLAMVVAFFGVVLPRHPLDYFYNSISGLINKPQTPLRTAQSKFACGVANSLARIDYSFVG